VTGRVLQVVPTFAAHDAIGDHIRQVDRLLRRAGYDTGIYATVVEPGLEERCRPARELLDGPARDAVVLYHHSTGSTVADHLGARPEPLIVDYHNITPAEMWDAWEPMVAVELSWGRRQLHQLAPRTAAALADSRFNADELEACGFAGVQVAPIVRDFGASDRAPRPYRARGDPEFLFVGRISPNKCQHELITALAMYRALFGAGARLRLVGRVSSPSYRADLSRLADELGVGGAVIFDDHGVPEPELIGAYQRATAFVCLSRHEGFCVPLVEAMRHALPVVARAGSAVTDTVSSGGLLLSDPDPVVVASAWHRVATDAAIWEALSSAALARAPAFDLEVTSRAFLDAFERAVRGL